MTGTPYTWRGHQTALGKAIKTLREWRGDMTSADLAKRAEIDAGELERLEAGTGDMDFGAVLRIGKAMEVSMGELGEVAEKFANEEAEQRPEKKSGMKLTKEPCVLPTAITKSN